MSALTPQRAFEWSAGVLVVLALIAGFWTIGSPGTRRLEREDGRRLNELQQIASTLNSYVSIDPTTGQPASRPLPATLAELLNHPVGSVPLADPTGRAYEYRMLDASRYELCATFNLAGPIADPQRGLSISEFWNHSAGRNCFTLNAREPVIYEYFGD